ncbi:energy-coupling factor transporter transmembrane component T [Geosporobacter ferrireducens]
MIIFQFVLLSMILLYMHPLYIVSILCFILAVFCSIGKFEKAKSAIILGLYNGLLILIINPLVSQSGRTILYRTPKIPVFGRVKITMEAIAYGTNMGLKLICIFLLFVLYGMMTDRDETFSFFSKHAQKLTLTLSLTVNIIHRLKIELLRVKDVMVLRGVNFQAKKLNEKIKAYYPVLKVILISSLEGSLDRAEALHSRSYGIGKRTSYARVHIKAVDYLFNGISFLMAFLLVYGLTTGRGGYVFYPELEPFYAGDIRYLLIIDFVLATSLLVIWGNKKWKFLKYRT